ncbi:MAG: right-handed parallel beta-helix repeat-containing protein [Deltaproteobacteria bacterium]|nr:right-handed parallel beta-helix repeat-containing protein [Deltaproteobacteria bacterium]
MRARRGDRGRGRRRLLPAGLFLVLAAAACGSSPDAGRDAGFDGPPPDVPLPTGTECPEAVAPVPVTDPDQLVGDGTPGSCTEAALRAAIAALNAGGGGSVAFDCGPAERTITLTAELFLDAPVVLDGGDRITLDGGGAVRILSCDNYVELTVQNIRLVRGRADESGSAIHLPWFGTLRVLGVTFEDNECTGVDSDIGGAIFGGGLTTFLVSGSTFVRNRAANGGAIVNNGSNLVIVDSVFVQNTAFGHGGSAEQGGLGGAVYIDGMHSETGPPEPFVLCGSTFRGNRSNQHGSAVFEYFYPPQEATIRRCEFSDNAVLEGTGGAVYHEAAPLTLLESTFAGNTATQHAGAIFIGSGSPATIENCTFADNEVPEVGAAIFSAAQDLTLRNCTFAGNRADYGPAIYNEDGTVTLDNTIFAGNEAAGPYNGQSCMRTMDGGAHNLQWPATRPNGSDDTPCVAGLDFADPQLGPLSDNGGPTRTMAPAAGSPALGAGADCPETDQRGEPRTASCDLGSVEMP